jgi:thioredoxin
MPVNIEVFSAPGCNSCGQAKKVIRKLVEQIGNDQLLWREVNIIAELDYAVELGILSTPAIAIHGKLVFTGLPSEKKLRAELLKQLDTGL